MLLLWIGRTVSVFGTRLDALTYCAVLTMAASPAQLGWLGALSGAPILLLSLSAGAAVDIAREPGFEQEEGVGFVHDEPHASEDLQPRRGALRQASMNSRTNCSSRAK